jgi:outer membrane lipoprotein-sorting protein
MKKLLVLAALLVSVAAQAQTADEVVAKYITAKGGADKLAALKTIRMSLEMAVMGNALSATTTVASGKGSRTEIDAMGQTITQAFDGTKGWMINPMMGSSDPQELPSEMNSSMADQIDLGGDLNNYAAKGLTVELVGKEKLEGKDVYVLRVIKKDGSTNTHYIDASTYQDIKTVVKAKVQGQDIEAETFLGDYQTVDGYTFPGTTETTNPQAGRIKIKTTKIEINPTVDEMMFKMPAKK